MKTLARYFLQGCLFLVPIAATVYVVYSLFVAIDGLIPLRVPGLGVLATVAIITLTGFLTGNVIGRRGAALLDRALVRLPLVKLIYTSIKDLIGAFIGDKKSFDRPVVVTLVPGGAAKALGFVTRDALQLPGLEDHVAVYFPQSYNFAGNLLLFPREQVRPVEADSSDLMTFIVSGGISGASPRAADAPRRDG